MTDASMTPAARTGKNLTSNLRFGWTTGTCATAAVNAAYTALVTGVFPERVTVVTPAGKTADLEIVVTESTAGDWCRAGVIKDAGDDPDVTHGAMIVAIVSKALTGAGIIFVGGAGVGIVAKPGLPVPV